MAAAGPGRSATTPGPAPAAGAVRCGDAGAATATGVDGCAGTIGTNSAYPRVPDGICTGIAQAGPPSGQTIDGIASVGGMTRS
ncbi:hypothetical protein ACWT_2228 [Actinoplanes sp. SE50]|uniref:hypothetical protein n=1 Tax=unclassified Actinoplanes TaxID=2626549 RepID=UPI00023ECE44|nr:MULTISPECIES: hypothetical protein [unclassified Actinoplanes]AEV83250.1 hypothetical protein ACPL_2355 [Actinoplanes sp. SE50/110]ATO81643.1 hypothetical protein ACWT_2228 [Actinoplanes sp. SE50]SLL99051.1 hypothetical protein ACSP50_2279 [Actinoplanes sp. SE50/110]